MNQINQQYAEHGYAIIEDAVPQSALEAIRQAAAQIVDEFDIDRHHTTFTTLDQDRGRDHYFMDSAQAVHCFLEEDALDKDGRLVRPKELAINKIGHAMHDLVPAFTRFCRQAVFRETLLALGYQAPLLWQTMYIFKQPRIGGEVRWHQDASYLITEPSSVVGFWIALEDAHRNNGCLWVQPGQHRSPLREIYHVDWQSRTGTLNRLDDTPWPDGGAVAVEVAAGSAIIFNDRLPHYSAQNTSGRSRHAFTLHVGETGARWSKRNWLQRPNLGEFAL